MYFLIGRSNSFMNMYRYVLRITHIARRTMVVVGLHYDVVAMTIYEDDKDYEDGVA